MKSRVLLTALTLLISAALLCQEGIIRGTVIEDAIGEPMIAVTVAVTETGTGTITDFDGTFEIRLEPGIYSLEVSFLGFQTVTITDVEVVEGEVNLFPNIRMKEESELLEEVVITAAVVKNTEAAIMTLQRKSPNLINGISSQTFRKIGDSNAAGAVKRVTGVSVEGGKYVYVRGLGDRYTKTMLNSMDIPGLDPDRNSLQIDIFPTNLIDQIVVRKSSLAEMPADFTGGVVDIVTKDFPDEKVFDISFGIDFNPSMHFNSDYLTYQGGDTDWLGLDDGTRSLTNIATQSISTTPSPPLASDGEVATFLSQFDPNLQALNQRSFLDYSFGVSLADQISVGNKNNSLGYIFSATYKNTTSFLDDLAYGEYQNVADADDIGMEYATIQNGALGTNNVLIGGLAGLAYKTKNAKYRLTAMHLQNGESRAAQLNIDNSQTAVGQSGYFGLSNNVEWFERSLTNLLINGKHINVDKGWELDWRLSPTLSRIDEPDIRKTAFTIDEPTNFSRIGFNAGAAGFPSRIWRELNEVNLVGRIDFKKDLSISGREAKFKVGFNQVYKDRDYEILSYDLQFFGAQPRWPLDVTANQVWIDQNLYPAGTAYLASGNTDPNSNAYQSTATNSAGYVSLEFEPIDKLKAVVGLRGEKFVQRHTGRDQRFAGSGGAEGNNLDNEEVLNAFDLFPSINLVRELTENQNIRVSYSRTIARPSFKELSFAQILDPITNRFFNGAFFEYEGEWDGNLTETRINNFDLRWEVFGNSAQNLSISGFYKTFDRPIELVRIPAAQTTNEFQPRNVGNGQVVGVEVEFSKTLDFLGDRLSNFRFNGNLTFAHSSIEMTDTEFNNRDRFEKVGETVENTRPMAGQAPYIINAGLAYADPASGLDLGLFYNVKGRTLTVVGGGLFPDVYSVPFHSLNFNLNKTFGKASVNFGITNILNSRRQEVFQAFMTADENFQSWLPGTSIGLGVNYSLL